MITLAAKAFVLVVFCCSAYQKSRHRDDFADYLRPYVGQHSGEATWLIILLESSLGVALASAGTTRIAALVALTYLYGACALYAVRLLTNDRTDCACHGAWDGATDPTLEQSAFSITRPAIHATEVSALAFVVWLTQWSFGVWSLTAISLVLLAPMFLVGLVLAVSIGCKLYLLRTPDTHPLVAEYMPRSRIIKGCSRSIGTRHTAA